MYYEMKIYKLSRGEICAANDSRVFSTPGVKIRHQAIETISKPLLISKSNSKNIWK